MSRALLSAIFLLLLNLNRAAAVELLQKPDLAAEGRWSLYLRLPEGAGPYPLVVFLPGCEGWGPWERQSAERHRAALAEAGWGIALLDVLGPRGIDSICEERGLLEGLRNDAALAATEATLALASDPAVDRERLVFMGQSFGGSIALDLASAHRRKLAKAERIFAAVVAYYPWCYSRYGMGLTPDFDTPVLVLAGAEDRWTPAQRCLDLQAADPALPFQVEIFPGAYHSFDLDLMPRYEIESVFGIQIVEGNAEAAAASRAAYRAWLLLERERK